MTLPAASERLAELRDEKQLSELVTEGRAALMEHWTPSRGGRPWMHEHAALLDAVVRRLFALGLERSGASSAGVAVVATGGYGQRLLAPHSDLDLTFLANRDDDSPLLRALFSLVMSVLLSGARIKVGYAYRTLADADGGGLDHQTQTALLDARFIAGDSSLFARFDRLYHDHLQAADFLFRKEAERARRHERSGASPYAAEPNVKEGAGGLRDIQTAVWMARVRFGKPGEGQWRDLVRRKVITKDDLHRMLEAREFLLATRCALHLSAGERREVLARPRQGEVAERMGFVDAGDTPSMEAFLNRWYKSAADIAQISDKVVARCLEAPIALGQGTGLSSVRRRVAVTDPARAETNRYWPMDALDFCQTHGLELALATEEAIQRHLEEGHWQGTEVLREVGRRFLSLLSRPGDVGATLRRLRRTSALQVILPELEACMGLLSYDPSHIHTVGEHSLHVLENLITLRDNTRDDDPRLGAYRAALLALDNPLPLFLAALLHDIGKQWPRNLAGERRGHSETGAERIPEIAERLGLAPAVSETLAFLVRQHLLLAETSRLRDLGQTATIHEAARTVGDGERLRMLYLLTWADTTAVGPGVLTEMNAHLLEELFLRTDAYLSRSRETEPPQDTGVRDARLETVRMRLQRQFARERALLEKGGVPPEAIREHVETMPAAYLLNTSPEKMSLHVAMIQRLHEGMPVAVDMRAIQPDAGQTEITVVTRDDPQPGLLSKLTGALLSCDVNLHAAQAFTREKAFSERIAIDTLRVDYKGRALGPDKRTAAEEAIRLVLSGEKTVGALLAQRRRTFNPVQPVRSLHVDVAAPDYTLVDVEAPDESGVVYRLAALCTSLGWNIHAARISAWGGNARCAFYVTDGDGQRIPVAAAEAELRHHLPLV